MPISPVTEQINEISYTVMPLPPKQAAILLFKVMKIAGVFASSFKNLKADKSLTSEEALEALGGLFSKLDPVETVNLIEELCKCAIQTNKQVVSLDQNFQGENGAELVEAIQVAWLVLRVNFKGVLSKLGNFGAGAVKAEQA